MKKTLSMNLIGYRKGSANSNIKFDDKISFLLDDTSDSSLDNDFEKNSSDVLLTIEYVPSFNCHHLEINSDDTLMEHRNELKEYYQEVNGKIINQFK